MAIQIGLRQTERVLFCGSKWWGDPDMPENMVYPAVEVTEGGETYEYPLTFICQINCEDIAEFDKDGVLPHEGMLYFFGAIDGYIGYDSPVDNGPGEWPKGHIVVKYAKSINFETFQTCMMTGEEGEQLTEQELEMVFSECEDDAPGLKLLGVPSYIKETDLINLLQIDQAGSAINILIMDSDLKFGNWKRSKGYLTVK